MKTKLLMALSGDVPQFIEAGCAKSLMLTHAERYLELPSMIFDLLPFISFLNDSARSDIIGVLHAKSAIISDPLRQSRALISVYKVRKVFGHLGKADVASLLGEY